MSTFILAQLAGYSLVQLLVMAVIVAACVGIAYVALQQFTVCFDDVGLD